MSNEIIDVPDSGAEPVVNLGSGQLVSMKAVQQIYSELTGRSETLESTFRMNHSVGFDDLCQLNAKVTQLCEQYNIVSSNCLVTLFHLDDQKQLFSSFERFKLYDRTTLSPVESIRIEYSFLIILPQMKRPQSYKVEINIFSRAAALLRAKADTGARAMMFYEFFAMNTAHAEIEFVDFTVARTFQNALDGWFKALPTLSSTRMLKVLKWRWINYFFIFRFGLACSFLVGCYSAYAVSGSLGTLNDLLAAAIVTFGGLSLMMLIAGRLGAVANDAVKRMMDPSYINLTRGDEIAFKHLQQANRRGWTKVAGALVLGVATKVVASIVISLMDIG